MAQTDQTTTSLMDVDGFAEYMSTRAARGDRSIETAKGYTTSVRKFATWYAEQIADQANADAGPNECRFCGRALGNPGARTTHERNCEESPGPPGTDDVLAWLDHLAMEEGFKGSTIQTHFYGVRAYFRWADHGGAELEYTNITERYPDRSGGTPDYLDWDEVEAIREATIDDEPDAVCLNAHCDRENWSPLRDWNEYDRPPKCPDCDTTNTIWSRRPVEFAVVQLFTAFGIRTGELVSVDVDDIDLENRTIDIRRQKRHTEQRDTMPMLDMDAYAVRNYLEHRTTYTDEARASDALFITNRGDYRASDDYLRGKFRAAAIRAGVRTFEAGDETKTEVYPHLIRHTVGHRLASAGYSDVQVGTYLGHAKQTSTSPYMTLAPEDIREMRTAVETGRRPATDGGGFDYCEGCDQRFPTEDLEDVEMGYGGTETLCENCIRQSSGIIET